MSDQHRIGGISIERSGSFVADGDIFENSAALKRQWFGQFVVPGFYNENCFLRFDFHILLSKKRVK
jgi:hypothetical protein